MTKYVIRQTRSFYGPSYRRGLVARGDGQAITFASRAEALAWIEAADAEVYHQSHNESGRPYYKIMRADRLPAYLAAYL